MVYLFTIITTIGAFSLTTLWAVEALGRAGQYDKALLSQAVRVFEVRQELFQAQLGVLRLCPRISLDTAIIVGYSAKRLALREKVLEMLYKDSQLVRIRMDKSHVAN